MFNLKANRFRKTSGSFNCKNVEEIGWKFFRYLLYSTIKIFFYFEDFDMNSNFYFLYQSINLIFTFLFLLVFSIYTDINEYYQLSILGICLSCLIIGFLTEIYIRETVITCDKKSILTDNLDIIFFNQVIYDKFNYLILNDMVLAGECIEIN